MSCTVKFGGRNVVLQRGKGSLSEGLVPDLNSYLRGVERCVKMGDKREGQAALEEYHSDYFYSHLSESKIVLHNVQFVMKEVVETFNLMVEKKGGLSKNLGEIESMINPFRHLFLTLSIILSGHQRYPSTRIYVLVAEHIISDIYKYNIELQSHESVLAYIDHLTSIRQDYLPSLGASLVNLFSFPPVELFTRQFVDWGNDLDHGHGEFLVINNDYSDLLADHIVLSPKSLPMLCPPNPWGPDLFGGFLDNVILRRPLFNSNKEHSHSVTGGSDVFDVVNRLNSTRFIVNVSFLRYIKGDGRYLLNTSTNIDNDITIRVADIYQGVPFYLNVNAD